MKRAALLILALSLILASCGESVTPDNPESTSGTTTEEITETTQSFDPGLPPRDLGGHTFTFAVRGEEGVDYLWNNLDIVAKVETGDVLNDS